MNVISHQSSGCMGIDPVAVVMLLMVAVAWTISSQETGYRMSDGTQQRILSEHARR